MDEEGLLHRNTVILKVQSKDTKIREFVIEAIVSDSINPSQILVHHMP